MLFIIIFLALFAALNYYIGLRLWQLAGSKASFLNLKVYWTVFTFMVLAALVGTVWSLYLPELLRDSFYLAGSYWLAAMTYFILAFAFIDLVRLLDRWIGFLPAGIKDNNAFSFFLGLVVIFFVISLLVYGTWNTRNLVVTSYEINIPKQAASLNRLRITMLSDTHFGPINDHRQQEIINTVNSLNPDLVLIAGDIIDDLELFEMLGIGGDLHRIKSKYGIYACLGNHDYLINDLDLITDRLIEAGINVLRDSSVKVAESFYIIGREDKHYEMISGNKRATLAELMQGMDLQLPIFLLDHRPADIEEAKNSGVDLQLSGHTHRGQFFPFNLVTRILFKVDYGYLETEGLQVIVTSGAATWGPRIRIGSTREVVEIIVNFGIH